MTEPCVEMAPPDIYESDLRDVVALMERLKGCEDVSDLFIAKASIEVHSRNDYSVGTLVYDGDQWRFTPHVDGSAG